MSKKVVKPTKPRHHGTVSNSISFSEAYIFILNNPKHIYHTTGNNSSFMARAYKSKKRKEKVITFKGIESNYVSAYVYECCWGKVTNCYGTYIDCYTKAMV